MPGAIEPSTASIPTDALHRLAVSIVHAFSNSLSVIIGNAQYLLLTRESASGNSRGGTDELTSTLEAILTQGQRLTGLMSLLLGLSSKLAAEGASTETALAEIEGIVARLMPPRRE